MQDTQWYKKSLHLPTTAFPMKARLPETEPKIIKKWEKMNIYEKIIKQGEGKPSFFLPDGPPYANGPIHLGHVVNKALKDFIIKYKNLSGFKAPFIPVWDCHGLPVELSVLKKFSEKNLSKKQIREHCRKEAFFWVEKQKESFKRLGVMAQWKKPHLTMDSHYEAEEVRALADIADNGLLYRGEKPVFWCFKLQTALAFSEAEYREHKSPSIYVAFDFDSESRKKIPSSKPSSVVIWTTTPWTLPANSAICLHPDFDYGLYEGENKSYLLAVELKDSFTKETGIALSSPKALFKGKDLQGLATKHPFIDRKSPLVLGDYVTLSAGTGCVHTAPGHGLEDYQTGKKFQLKTFSPVDEKGHFNEEAPSDLQGLFIFKGNKVILEKLRKTGHLLGEQEITHSYPYNARSNSPLIYRLTSQWFLKLDKKEFPLRAMALKASDSQIRFVSPWGKARLDSMLQNSPDWCLSRQRAWGVPLIVFYCENCHHPYLSTNVMREVAKKMEKTGEGIEYYFSTAVSELLPKNIKCSACGTEEFYKGEDILDVWFDSGIEHRIFRKTHPFPADLLSEGSDQHRGWFQTSLLSSLAIDKTVPFQTLLTHGFVTDSKGLKMSKSLGNRVDPMDMIKDNGAEILRLWVASEDYSDDINPSKESFQRVTETYRRFRNTFRFLLGNTNDFQWEKHALEFEKLHVVDKWMLIKLSQLITESKTHYERFAFHKVYHELNRFFTVHLSAFYLDIIKDRLYTFGENTTERRAAQTVLFHLIKNLLPLITPLATFLTEEVYGYFNFPGKKKSVLLEDFPQPNSQWKDKGIEPLFFLLFPLREELNKQLEALREKGQIGSGLQAGAVVASPETFMTEQELCEFFGVSQVVLEKKETLSVKAFLAPGEKCLRCWFYSSSLNKEKLCPKCVKNLS